MERIHFYKEIAKHLQRSDGKNIVSNAHGCPKAQ